MSGNFGFPTVRFPLAKSASQRQQELKLSDSITAWKDLVVKLYPNILDGHAQHKFLYNPPILLLM